MTDTLLTMPFTADSKVTEFGNGLALSGDGSRSVVGAAYQDTPTTQMEAPVFVYLNGVLEATLNPTYATTNHANNAGTAFGRGSVSISNAGDVIAIGAPSYDANPNGAAYDGIDNWNYNNGSLHIFRRSGVTWSQEAFFPSDGSNNDQLGRAVAISGDGTRIAITSEYRLLVYKYDAGEWSLEFSTECPATTAYSGYKYCVAISGDGSTVVTSDKGGAYLYVYRRTGSTWTSTPEIISGFSQSETAGSLDISANNVIVAGVSYEGIGESWGVGKACIFEYNGTTWGTPTVLTGDINITDGYFGEGAGISGDGSTVAVAYPGYAGTFEQQGGIQIFRKVSNVWTLVYTHVLANPLEWDGLGYYMALSNDGLHVAAWLATNPSTTNVGEISGKVYLFAENAGQQVVSVKSRPRLCLSTSP